MAKHNIRRSLVFHDFYTRLKNMALSRHEWVNLPETCNARFLEDCLFHQGQAIFVEDREMSFLNLKATAAGALNPYNEPLAFNAFSTGYSKIYDADECVMIYNNLLKKSTDSTIILFAERLAKIQMAIEININAQKTPILVRCDDKTKRSLEVLYENYEGDKPFILASKSLQEKPLEVLTTGAPYVAEKLREEKTAVWNEALEFLGINTNPSDKKKERLIVDEVGANNEQIDTQAQVMLACRQEACEKINEKWGLNVSVRLRTDNTHPGKPPESEEVA